MSNLNLSAVDDPAHRVSADFGRSYAGVWLVLCGLVLAAFMLLLVLISQPSEESAAREAAGLSYISTQ
jgi:hypothetical protein